LKHSLFISNSLDVRETFKFASPVEILRAVKVYTCSFYGSNLWDLGGPMAGQVYTAWDTCVRLAWSVPRATRGYLVHHVLSEGMTSARVDILSKFVGFFKGLRFSPSPEVSFMAYMVGRDLRTVLGRNLQLIEEESGLNPSVEDPRKLKAVLYSFKDDIPVRDAWCLKYLGLLLEQRQEAHYCGLVEEEDRLDNLIDSLCVN
jgi:hypothetical protein